MNLVWTNILISDTAEIKHHYYILLLRFAWMQYYYLSQSKQVNDSPLFCGMSNSQDHRLHSWCCSWVYTAMVKNADQLKSRKMCISMVLYLVRYNTIHPILLSTIKTTLTLPVGAAISTTAKSSTVSTSTESAATTTFTLPGWLHQESPTIQFLVRKTDTLRKLLLSYNELSGNRNS